MISLLAGPAGLGGVVAGDAQDANPARADASLARRFPEFSLPTTTAGETVSLAVDPRVDFQVICFLGTECPLARVYGPRLQRLADEFSDRGVSFLGVVSNVQDSIPEIAAYRDEHGIEFPIGKDLDQQVAIQAGATRTPEVFVIDRDRTIRYQGRIDDQYRPGVARNQAQVHDLRDALEALLAGQSVNKPQVAAVGCLIALRRSEPIETDVTFCNEVLRILQRNCIECHRGGQIGPFALDDYEEVVGWGDMSIEVIDDGRMPPWHADPDVGQFANARRMSEADKQTLRRWVAGGMPYGDPRDLPPAASYADGWRMSGEPDLVLSMSDEPFPVPAEGTVEYQYFVVDPGFTEDTWIRAAQVIPGNPSVVHHCIVFQRPPDGASLKGAGMLSAYVPGQITADLPEGFAYRIAAGSHLVFQMHYTPNGQPQQDLTRLGLLYADADEVTHEVYVINGMNTEFEIPPRAPNHAVTGRVDWFPADGMLLSITPHMHVRGKSFELFTHRNDETACRLRVPGYDFNWQHDYDLATPLPLGDVDEITFRAVFDNSPGNPFNPDPQQHVTWGDQTWEEMAVVFLRVAEPIDPPGEESDPEARQREQAQREQMQWALATQFGEEYIARFDQNDDGRLSPHEVPKSVRAFRFSQYDRDDDGYLTCDEMAANARDRYLEAIRAGTVTSDGRKKF